MATTDTQKGQQSRQGEGTEQTTGTQGRGLAQRGTYDPLGFSVFPVDFLPTPFSMNPFAMLRRMTQDMDRASSARGADRPVAAWAPTIEITATDDNNIVIRAELPGLKPEEVKIEVVDDALVIEGERKFEQEDARSHRTERMYGRFYRVIQLPEGADVEQARARFQDGMLEVTVPVKEPQSSRREIPIDTGASGSARQTGQQTGQQTTQPTAQQGAQR
jgi:HSP20 family protein